MYFYIEVMRQLENKFSDKLETLKSSFEEFVTRFDQDFQKIHGQPAWENLGDGFGQGSASVEDWRTWGENNEIDLFINGNLDFTRLDEKYIGELEYKLEEKCAKVLNITEEQIETFFDENISGRSYEGSFRPYHFVAIDPRNSEIYESTQVSSNSWDNYLGFKVWDNSEAGTFDITTLGIDCIIDNIESVTEFIEQYDPEAWKSKSRAEKVEFVKEFLEDNIYQAGMEELDMLREEFVSWVKGRIKEEGYFLNS